MPRAQRDEVRGGRSIIVTGAGSAGCAVAGRLSESGRCGVLLLEGGPGRQPVRERGISNLHPVGTCWMGREVDAAVDPRLKVHGLAGLRAADASMMPQVPGGNTNAPSITAGKKCAAMMLEDARAR